MAVNDKISRFVLFREATFSYRWKINRVACVENVSSCRCEWSRRKML